MSLTFTDDDVEQARGFGKFIQAKAEMKLSIPEAVQLNRYLAFYNQLTRKIEAHVMELKKIVTAPEESSGDGT